MSLIFKLTVKCKLIYLNVDVFMFQTNETGTKIVSDCECPLLVFDVVNRCLEVTITPQMVKQKDGPVSV